jgi:hypothetical protein
MSVMDGKVVGRDWARLTDRVGIAEGIMAICGVALCWSLVRFYDGSYGRSHSFTCLTILQWWNRIQLTDEALFNLVDSMELQSVVFYHLLCHIMHCK